ncbi:MAG: DUF935 domain-containing protein [Mesorhizobium sp.]|uniref:DUF935 domain-containing protein n=1 Tax=Mesorhizobium sp. TaxID=1871066 RepID=UPI000FE99FB8|nr:DUF935 domain-containing protein [Mesorhizobium sp.]RWO97203.1 MAG: DUF935 domain-containing protein [Mesorhizobium sp.]TIM52580.1 MAG: DUF935 domain-containing protein [Mesorhizobium sp.]
MAEDFKGIVDRYGRPIAKAALKVEQAAPTGSGVRRHDALHPAAGLTPGRLGGILRASIDNDPESYLALAEDMEERDPHYAGVLGVRKRQVSGLDITVEAAGEDAASVEHADLVREVIERDGFEDELFDIQDAVGKGFSCTEIVWDTSAGQWRPKRLAWRDPRWFVFDQIDGETPLLRDAGQNVPLNPYQWIYHSAKVKSGLPIRGGIARAVAWTFLFKSFTIKDWAIFCEAYGQPLRLGKYDAGASEKDKQILLEAVSNIGVDYAAIVPASMAVEFIKADISGSHGLYKERADWLDQQTSKVVLGQTATTDAIAGGHAVGKTHDGVREDIEKADARQLAASLNRDLARPLVDLNHGPQKKYPRILIGRPEQIDITALVNNVAKLVPLGLKVGMSTMRDRIGIPDPADDEELLGAPKEPPPVDPPAGPVPARPKPGETEQTVHSTAGTSTRDAIERAAADMLADWMPLVSPIAAGLGDEIAIASSVEDVKALLAKRFEGLNVDALTEMLARSAFAARLAGEADETL